MRRRSPHIRHVAALAVAGACLLAACGEGGEDEGLPPLGPLKPIRAQADFVTPLDHYMPTPRQRAVIATAKSELTARCMEKMGFTGYPVDSYAAQAEIPLHGNTFGVFDEDIARRHGYTPSFNDALMAQNTDIELRFAEWSSPAISEALNGRARPRSLPSAGEAPVPEEVPVGGCEGAAAKELYGYVGASPPTTLVNWIETLQMQAGGRAMNDPRMKAPTEAWSRCMKDRGYDFATPTDSNNTLGGEQTDHDTAVKGALADVRCKWSSGFIDTQVALVAAYENQVIEKNAERLQTSLDERKRLLAAIAQRGLGRIREPLTVEDGPAGGGAGG